MRSEPIPPEPYPVEQLSLEKGNSCKMRKPEEILTDRRPVSVDSHAATLPAATMARAIRESLQRKAWSGCHARLSPGQAPLLPHPTEYAPRRNTSKHPGTGILRLAWTAFQSRCLTAVQRPGVGVNEPTRWPSRCNCSLFRDNGGWPLCSWRNSRRPSRPSRRCRGVVSPARGRVGAT